jgi:hypothetical protein
MPRTARVYHAAMHRYTPKSSSQIPEPAIDQLHQLQLPSSKLGSCSDAVMIW